MMMMRILMKAASSTEKTAGSSPSERRDVDLSTWELVNASQSDDEVDLCSFDGDDVTSEDDAVADASDPAIEFASAVEVVSIQDMSVSPPMTLPVAMSLDNHDDDGEDDDGDEDDGGDYDDDLMPWNLKDRFGKERMKKLGKRGPKPNRAKRMPIYYNRAGCLFGKHGYGVHHSFV